jgi:hypothetical protein
MTEMQGQPGLHSETLSYKTKEWGGSSVVEQLTSIHRDPGFDLQH